MTQMQITPDMLDKDAHKTAHLAWQKALRECVTVECESDHEGIFLATYLNALLASGKAQIEDREDWENRLQSIKRSTFVVIRLDSK